MSTNNRTGVSFSFGGGSSSGGINSIIGDILDILRSAAGVIIAIAVVYFLWGMLKYIKTAVGEEKEEARGMIVNGIIVLFVMVSIWGLVGLISNTINVGSSNSMRMGSPIFINSINLGSGSLPTTQ